MMETEFLDDAINRSVLVVRPAEPFNNAIKATSKKEGIYSREPTTP
jgi:hypothetical protein